MWCSTLILVTTWLSTLGSAASQNYTYSSTAGTNALAAKGLANLAAYERGKTQLKSCTLENTSVRYEWCVHLNHCLWKMYHLILHTGAHYQMETKGRTSRQYNA